MLDIKTGRTVRLYQCDCGTHLGRLVRRWDLLFWISLVCLAVWVVGFTY